MPGIPKVLHEIRDPIYAFIQVSSDEREIINSRPVQRLRHVHQLALTNLVYPGATHMRFEHSLGTMHLASQVYDVVTRPQSVTDAIRSSLPQINEEAPKLAYWRSVLRMAALCHDLGHLPFSHAAETQLLPPEWSHERLSRELIMSREMSDLFMNMTPPLKPEHIVKIAIGKRKAPDLTFSLWEDILSEIVVGDAFGVDRIDYLLRDSYHAGVAYGRFDHHRLTATLRILPSPPRDEKEEEVRPPALGVEEGGLHSAEALLLARYFMYSQVYFHPVRRVYDLHLIKFLQDWLEGGTFSVDLEKHLAMTDNEVFTGISLAAQKEGAKGHDPAERILARKHFKLLYHRRPDEATRNPEVVGRVAEAATKELGEGNVLEDEPEDLRKPPDFPVLRGPTEVVSSETLSDVLKDMPVISLGYVFVRPELLDQAWKWLEEHRAELTEAAKEA